MNFEIRTISDWYLKKSALLSIVCDFDFEVRRDFKVLFDTINNIVMRWDNSTVDYRRHPTIESRNKCLSLEEDFNSAITVLQDQILLSKLYKF